MIRTNGRSILKRLRTWWANYRDERAIVGAKRRHAYWVEQWGLAIERLSFCRDAMLHSGDEVLRLETEYSIKKLKRYVKRQD